MMRSMRSPQSEIDNSLAHTFVGVAGVAVVVALSNKDDTNAVPADGAGPAHGKSIDSVRRRATDENHSIRRCN